MKISLRTIEIIVTSKSLNNISSYIKNPAIPDKGGVFFKGSLKDMYTINMYSRTGMFVLRKLFFFKAHNYNDLYKKIFDYS